MAGGDTQPAFLPGVTGRRLEMMNVREMVKAEQDELRQLLAELAPEDTP